LLSFALLSFAQLCLALLELAQLFAKHGEHGPPGAPTIARFFKIESENPSKQSLVRGKQQRRAEVAGLQHTRTQASGGAIALLFAFCITVICDLLC
jgi:hypothetical protein